MHAAYIHIPFCQHICYYCDFNKFYLKNQPVDEYLMRLDKEMQLKTNYLPVSDLKTIFVGGGTPTALSAAQLEVLLKSIRNRLPFSNGEFTFEANPGDLTEDKLRVLKDYGVNRLSIGVQSFDDDLLKKIGRTHSSKDVYTTVNNAQKAGFDNISLDLIFALPGQTIEDFKHTLETALSFQLAHYSGYSLIIEPKTIFYNRKRQGKLILPSEDNEAIMYQMLLEEMENNGYNQYEISNFSKPSFESQHNLVYWKNEPYFGFGAGAHGYENGYRVSNYGPLKKYMDPLANSEIPYSSKHKVTDNERMEEEMFLGLRKTEGVNIALFEKKYHQNLLSLFKKPINELLDRDLIQIDQHSISLTSKGKLLGNEVFESFLLA